MLNVYTTNDSGSGKRGRERERDEIVINLGCVCSDALIWIGYGPSLVTDNEKHEWEKKTSEDDDEKRAASQPHAYIEKEHSIIIIITIIIMGWTEGMPTRINDFID